MLWRARARTYARRRLKGRQARARARPSPRQRLAHSAGCAAAAAAVGTDGLRVRGPRRVCDSGPATLTPVSVPGAEKGTALALGILEAHPWLLPTPPSFPSQPRASLGARRLRGEAAVTIACPWRGVLPKALLRCPGPAVAESSAPAPSRLFRQRVRAASVREVSGLRRRLVLRLHHVRGRRLREPAEEIQAGVPGGAERWKDVLDHQIHV